MACSNTSGNAQINTWSQMQLDALVKLRDYHFQMSGYLNLLIHGRQSSLDLNQRQPKKPELDTIQKIQKLSSPADILEDPLENLQEELKNCLPNAQIESQLINWEEIFSNDLDLVAPNICTILEGIKQKQVFGDFLFLGELFEKLFCHFQHKKLMGLLNPTETWVGWLKLNNIDYSLTRKYREMYQLLKNHKRFYLLCIPFDNIYKKRKLIKLLLSKPEQSQWL